MKRTTILTLAAFAVLTLTLNGIADARRMGGGGNFGAQRSVPAQKAGRQRPRGQRRLAIVTTAITAGRARFGECAQGPARGSSDSRAVGRVALARPDCRHRCRAGARRVDVAFGIVGRVRYILLLALVIFAGIFVLRMFLGRRQTSGAPLQYSGATASANGSGPSAFTPSAPSAPSWRIPSTSELAGQPTSPSATEAPAVGVTRNTLPQGFDAAAFAREAKRQYIQIQRSYDDADRAALSSVMTEDMATEMVRELDQRGLHHPTEIVTLDAEVLDVSTEDDKYWISVRFTGQVKEDGETLPHSIDEVWNLTKPVKGGSGWLLAGISQVA